jgi:hypothetical protein
MVERHGGISGPRRHLRHLERVRGHLQPTPQRAHRPGGLEAAAGEDPADTARSSVAPPLRDDDAAGRRGRGQFLQVALLDYVKAAKPRVLFVGYGETDNWAHQGRYDLVLDSAHRTDAFVRELWDTMQAMPEYRGTTTFIITTDHGRGGGLAGWKEHGIEEKGSENVWMAVIGPDTSALGERRGGAPVIQAQIAATLAAFIGRDYRAAVPRAAPPIEELLH